MVELDTNAQLIVRYLRLRGWPEVQDLLDASQPGRLAFDELELEHEVDELERAAGREALERFTLEVLAGRAAPFLGRLEDEPARARAFLELMAANLAFALRSDATLDALVAFPALDAATKGALLARAGSRRQALARIEAAPLDAAAREAARAAATELAVPTGPAVLFVVPTERHSFEPALEQVMARADLVPVVWISRVASEAGRRLIVLPRSGAWLPLLAPAGVERELAADLARTGGIRATAWVHLEPERGVLAFEVREGARAVDDEARLAARLGAAPVADDVAGALRARSILAYDPIASADAPALSFERLSPPSGAPCSPSVLRKVGAAGYAFAKKAAAREAEQARAGKRAARKRRERRDAR